MKISELSRITGVSIRMIRYYEQQGCLSPTRTPAGYRQYQLADIERIETIKRFKTAGFTLEEMRPVLACELNGPQPGQLCAPLRTKLQDKLSKIDQSIAYLIATRDTLLRYL